LVKRYVLSIIVISTVIFLLFLINKSQEIPKFFKSEVLKGLKDTPNTKPKVLTENDIRDLPNPVQRYLKYVGVMGKERVRNLRIVSKTHINLGTDKGWTEMETVEYNFYNNHPKRLAYMKFKTSGIPILGLDSYINGQGNMLMKPLGLFAVVNAGGKDMDNTSAAVMLFLNMCTAAPASLIDERIKWTTINASTVKATFEDKECKVSAILVFNDNGELTNFSTEDKYYSPTGNFYQKVRWSTPVLDYKEINGLRLSTYGEAIWHFDNGDYCYGKNTLKEIEYNCQGFK
jgi:hypothetical protein